jgi:phage terminase large subunit GpA-like protein
VDSLKETVYARLRILEPGPGYAHFPIGRTLDQFEMLTSETRRPDYTNPIPVFRWEKKQEGGRNEWLDIRAYHHACLRGLEFQTAFRLEREVERVAAIVAARVTGGRPAPAGLRIQMPAVVEFTESGE